MSTLDEDPRYYAMPMETIHAADLLGDIGYTLGAGPDTDGHAIVHSIVDETDGIIAYALGEDVAQRIIAALAAVPETDHSPALVAAHEAACGYGGPWYIEGPRDPLDGDPLYWCNAQGWVSFQTADKYPDRTGNLPDGGKWVPA